MSLCAACVYKSLWWPDSLELVWQEVVSHCMGAGTKPRSLQGSRALSPVALQIIF